jgi:hypothetical protein
MCGVDYRSIWLQTSSQTRLVSGKIGDYCFRGVLHQPVTLS